MIQQAVKSEFLINDRNDILIIYDDPRLDEVDEIRFDESRRTFYATIKNGVIDVIEFELCKVSANLVRRVSDAKEAILVRQGDDEVLRAGMITISEG